jgi:hypothetical protein
MHKNSYPCSAKKARGDKAAKHAITQQPILSRGAEAGQVAINCGSAFQTRSALARPPTRQTMRDIAAIPYIASNNLAAASAICLFVPPIR